MFGSPLIVTFIVGALFLGGGLLGFSLIEFSPKRVAAPVTEVQAEESNTIGATLIIRSAHPMASVTCALGGVPLELDLLAPNEAEATIAVGPEVALKLEVTWQEGTPETAVLVQVEPDGSVATERTLWAQGSLAQELNFFL